MKAVSSAEARKRFFQLIDETAETHEPIQISGKRNNAVWISEQDWKSIQEALYLVSIPGMRDSIVEGLKTPLNHTSEELNW